MTIRPQPGAYAPETQITTIEGSIAVPVQPASFPDAKLRFRNDRWAASVGLDTLTDSQWIAHFGRFEPLPGNLPQPLALAYHGHQFRVYNPDIGDGRGFLFAQMRDHTGRLLDLGTKGSGTTPYSRQGDGRLTLKGGVREILATEMLEALGVNTSKTFSLIETGEQLWRGDEPSPTRSAVLVRLSHGNIRIGTFQRLAALEDEDALRRLVRYALDNYHDGATAENDAALLLERVVEKTAQLAASYMAAGFVHGVLNTDNINISGESFDYGPWRWTPRWEPGFTAAYFDHGGLYAFARQPEAIYWNCGQLAIALRTISDAPPLIAALARFGDIYQREATRCFLWRLGISPGPAEDDVALVSAAEQALRGSDITIDRFFFDWMGRTSPPPGYEAPAFSEFVKLVEGRTPSRDRNTAYWRQDEPCSMHIDEVEAIWSAIDQNDDWQPLYAKVDAIRAMGDALSAV